MTQSTKPSRSIRQKLPFAMLGSLSLWACASVNKLDNADPAPASTLYPVSITRHTTIIASQEKVFDVVVADDILPRVLTGYGPLPAVTGTSNQSASWDHPGATRVVHLKDRSTVREQITGFERPHHFNYRIWDFTNPIIRRLAESARGDWTLREWDNGTQIEWTYTFYTSKRWIQLPLSAIVNIFWRGYMDVCLENLQEFIETT